MISIVEQIFHAGREHPHKTALQNAKCSLTYGELLEGILYAKQVLSDTYGINRGNRVILAADMQLEFAAVYFACHLLQAVTLPIAPDTNEKRYSLIKAKVNPSLVVGFKDTEPATATAKLSDFTGSAPSANAEAGIFPDLDSVADILFTTGTTGEPKGVQLSHRNIAAAAGNINSFIGNQRDDVEMLALPISHSFGLGRMRCVLSKGQTMVMTGGFANVKRFFRFMDEYKVNGFGMVPASWALLKRLSGSEISRYQDQLHYVEIGSAPMPMEEKQTLMKLLPHTRICMHYGLTEASRSAFMEFHEEAGRLDTVGRESPNMHITIRNEKGDELQTGEEGEICVSGDAVTIGYLDLPRAESFWNDSFRTGDWGFRDADGYISLKSRKKELINVGGKKVSPIEVEEVLKRIDFVDDCVCVGIPDPEGILGEVVKAFLVVSDSESVTFSRMEELIGNRLEGYKHPVSYGMIQEIPRTASGKVQRLLLK